MSKHKMVNGKLLQMNKTYKEQILKMDLNQLSNYLRKLWQFSHNFFDFNYILKNSIKVGIIKDK